MYNMYNLNPPTAATIEQMLKKQDTEIKKILRDKSKRKKHKKNGSEKRKFPITSMMDNLSISSIRDHLSPRLDK